VPYVSVTTRLPKGATNSPSANGANASETGDVNAVKTDRKSKETPQPIEVVFVVEGDHVKMVPVKIGIYDEDYMEITEGVTEGQEVVSGGYKAVSRDLEDGRKIRKGAVIAEDKKS